MCDSVVVSFAVVALSLWLRLSAKSLDFNSFPLFRGSLVAATLGSKAFFAGGYNFGGYSAAVDIFDAAQPNATKAWYEY